MVADPLTHIWQLETTIYMIANEPVFMSVSHISHFLIDLLNNTFDSSKPITLPFDIGKKGELRAQLFCFSKIQYYIQIRK